MYEEVYQEVRERSDLRLPPPDSGHCIGKTPLNDSATTQILTLSQPNSLSKFLRRVFTSD